MNSTVKRSISGVLFLAIVLGGLLFNEVPFVILFAFITAVMLYEFYRMTMGETYKNLQIEGIILGLFFFICGFRYYAGENGAGRLLAMAILFLVLLMCATVLENDHNGFLKTGYLLAGQVYITLPMALSPAVVYASGQYNGLLMVAFFIIIWSSDVGAYCFGMLFGQKGNARKMCPEISPKKSWAGFWGGLAASVLAGAILYWTGLFKFPIWHALTVAAIMNVAGVFGDLFESLWKRAAHVKDSGKIMPGHGGLMDRFDSALFAIPAGFVYLMLFNLV